MELKKSKKADLERKRPLLFLIGLVLPALLFVAALELVMMSVRSAASSDSLEDLLEENELKLKREREDMVAAIDLHQKKPAPPKTERVNIVDELKQMEKLNNVTEKRMEGEEEGTANTDGDKDNDKDKQEKPAAVDMNDNPLNFRIVEQLPEFPGGMSAYVKWLTDNLKYPYAAQQKKIEGRVVVSFVINKDGSLSDIKVTKSADPILDKEALRVARKMPNWKPGINKNKPCRTLFAVPIDFKL